jgi:hypothetical protein
MSVVLKNPLLWRFFKRSSERWNFSNFTGGLLAGVCSVSKKELYHVPVQVEIEKEPISEFFALSFC